MDDSRMSILAALRACRQSILQPLIVSLFTVTISLTAVRADDTEVFFARADAGNLGAPNILFILDSSSSMHRKDPGIRESRMTRLKAAMQDVLSQASNVNFGFMRFNKTQGESPVMYPITPIDELKCYGSGCQEHTTGGRIDDPADDASEYRSVVKLNGRGLTLGNKNPHPHYSGFRFPKLSVPAGARITDATLEVTSSERTNNYAEYHIRALAVDDAPVLNDGRVPQLGAPVTGSSTTWYPGGWQPGTSYTSPDLSTVIQEVIDRDDWCGGNALTLVLYGYGDRQIESFESASDYAAKISVSYDPTSIAPGDGCMKREVVSQVFGSSGDAEESLKNRKVRLDDNVVELPRDGDPQLSGFHFPSVSLPAGAIIDDARLQFTVDAAGTGDVDLMVYAEAVGDASPFSSKKKDLTKRSTTAADIIWSNVPNPDTDATVVSDDISPVVEELIARSDWTIGNGMNFFLESVAGSGYRQVRSFDQSALDAARLRIVYRQYQTASADLVLVSARDEMSQVVTDMYMKGGSPIVETLYESSNYLSGRPVSNHPWGEYFYDSPMSAGCQANHIILLSDGGPTDNSIVSEVENRIGVAKHSCVDRGAGECGPEFTSWMYNEDQSDFLPGIQRVATHTISLAWESEYLRRLSKAGGGQHYEVYTQEDLYRAFMDILGNVLKFDTSFVAPSTTVNQFNRLEHKDEIYFSLFTPAKRIPWDGNLKKYRIRIDSGGIARIYDNSDPGKPAIDPETGFFASNTRSVWSNSNDGHDISAGGFAARLGLVESRAQATRAVFTNTSDSMQNVRLYNNDNRLHESNNKITDELLGLDRDSVSRERLLEWARGVDLYDSDGDGDRTDIRPQIGDPLHSRPVLLNYSTTSGYPEPVVFMGTNSGFLHAVNATSGDELFAYIPQEFLPSLRRLYEQSDAESRRYGIDGPLSLWHDDINLNGLVEGNEQAMLYFGLRRGGNQYYALDITDRRSPELKWAIQGGAGGTPGFKRLGQTWSKPVAAEININGDRRTVLIFGGGYDDTLDPDENGIAKREAADPVGNALYMVDARTGKLIWSASSDPVNDGPGMHTFFPAMRYSIPSDLRVIDLDGNGLLDHIFVGDLGGQVWRLDFNNTDWSSDFVSGGVLAALADDNGAANARRFFYEPDVALVSADRDRFLTVSIGSGWRAHPLDVTTDDRLYVLRADASVDATSSNLSNTTVGAPGFEPVTDGALTDVTDNLNYEIDWREQRGWKLRLPAQGEKVLSRTLTANHQVVVTTYEPNKTVSDCSTTAGGGNVYVLDVLSGKPTIDLESDGELTVEDRVRELKRPGIPPEAVALFPEDAPPVLIVGSEQPLDEFDFGPLTHRTYWVEERNRE